MNQMPELISSFKGEIKEILLVYPGLSSEEGDLEYADIVSQFDKKGKVFRFKIETPNFALKVSRLRQYFANGRNREIIELRPAIDISSVLESWHDEIKSIKKGEILTFRRWAQDPFLVLASGNWTILLDSVHNRRMCDFFLPIEIAQQVGNGCFIRPTRLYLEGGNILRGINQVFIGNDLIKQNSARLGLSETAIIEELKETLGHSEVFPIGLMEEVKCLKADGGDQSETFQPLFHIDMLMTLGGIDEVTKKEIIFLADTKLCTDILRDSGNPKVHKSEAEDRAKGMLDEVRDNLQEAGFLVHRLPIFFYDNTTYSWNNCLVEVFENTKTVYLPSFQCEYDPEKLNPTFQHLEMKVEQIYQRSGFEVIWFTNGRFFRTLARHGGSLHCIVKVMKRSDR